MNKKERLREVRKLEKNKTSVHHIINRASRELFANIENNENKKRLPNWYHRSRHDNQSNNHPLETLQDIERITQVMSPLAKELYLTLCNMSIDEFYDKKFLPKK